MKIEQIYHPYWLWEDVGMYRDPPKGVDRSEKVIDLMTHAQHFYRVAKWMTLAYPYSCEHNLTNHGMNRIAYIGQASCYYAYGITEEETRKAWGLLTDEQRKEANEVAKRVLNEWEEKYIKNHAGY